MKSFNKIIYLILLLYLISYAIIPTSKLIIGDILVLLLLIVQLLAFILIKKERSNVLNILKHIFKDKIFLSLILLNLAMYISIIFAVDKSLSITHSIRFSIYIFIFYSISYKVKDNHIRILFKSVIGIVILSGIYAFAQLSYVIFLGYKIDKTIRIPSFLENPNNLAAYTLLSFFILLMLLFNSKNIKFKIFLSISCILLFINIAFSQSRNAFLALIVGMFIITILYNIKFLYITIFLPIILFLIPTTRLRILQIFDASQNDSRFKIWEITKQIISDNPINGIGYDNFSIYFTSYAEKNPLLNIDPSYIAYHPHNTLLKMQVELGILGTVTFLFFIIATSFTLYKLVNISQNIYTKNIMTGVTVGYFTFLFMNLLDSYFNAPKVIITTIILLAFANHYRISLDLKTNKT